MKAKTLTLLGATALLLPSCSVLEDYEVTGTIGTPYGSVTGTAPSGDNKGSIGFNIDGGAIARDVIRATK